MVMSASLSGRPSRMKYRKKPVVIEAEEWWPGVEIEGVEEIRHSTIGLIGRIKTLEDTDESARYVTPGDFIITGVEGEKYACKPDIFHKTYEPVDK